MFKERAGEWFPFGIAIVLPPAGLAIAFVAAQEDQDLGIRIGIVALISGVVWTLLLLGG